MEPLEQKVLHLTYGGTRCYMEGKSLQKAGFVPGQKYKTNVQANLHEVEFVVDDAGNNTVSGKKKADIVSPVIDKAGREIKEALSSCDFIKVTFYEGRVVITGQRKTADILSEKKSNSLSCITFCAGSGITSECNKEVGFTEVAACEYNPKKGAEDKFAEIYSANHPDSVMFNIPMEKLDANDLPYADAWIASLDCTDFSKLSQARKQESGEFQTMHLFMHLIRLFWQKPPAERPKAILIENVEGFKNIAGNSVKLCLEEEGYHVKMAKLNSLNYGSRTKRERFFLVGTIYEGFEFPQGTGKLDSPIISDGVISLENLKWVTPAENETLKYFTEREKKGMAHNHKMTCFDITKDSYIGTITKSHHKTVPYNWIKHPDGERYAQLRDEKHLKYLHGIRQDYYLGDSFTSVSQCIGQAVCCHTFRSLVKSLYDFLLGKSAVIHTISPSIKQYYQPSLFEAV